jgi:type VI secretion system secreted protein VgrG
MAASTLSHMLIAFKSGALPDDDIRLLRAVGTERLSSLFEFDLTLFRASPLTDAEIDSVLKAPCAIALGPDKGDVVSGILRELELVDAVHNGGAWYTAKLVPSVWLMTLARTNRLFQKTTVAKMVQTVLEQYGLASGADFQIAAWDKAPTREYVVQYEESDWSFIQRWLEHEGYFYWFEHDAGGEKLVIAHENAVCPSIAGEKALLYRPRSGMQGKHAVLGFRVQHRRIPARVVLFDYNYRRPGTRVVCKADVDRERGFGSAFFYGDHFKDQTEGDAIAKIRAERIACERETATGSTDCPRFRVGHVFDLEDYPVREQDGPYLITAVRHRVADEALLEQERETYRAEFEALPFGVPFRPARETEWPSIHGVIHGHIDSDGSGDYAQIDDQGRYRVRLPFDGSGAAGSSASRWIRMAQHYAGAGYGSHFPLHKGAEVIIAHVDGDPDRPVIVGSVPNPHTLTPSTSSNATQSVIHTASGIRIEMEDSQK